jgi:hypothetical protein
VSSLIVKFKIIILTFVATTIFWALAVIGYLWLASENSGVSFVEDAHRRGFLVMMRAANEESQPVTFVVEELHTNAVTADAGRTVLLERQLPPTGEFWVGIKKTKTDTK